MKENLIPVVDSEGGVKKTPEIYHKEIPLWTAMMDIIKDAVPASMGVLFIFIAETINIIFVGLLGKPELISGIGIGTLYINATGYLLGVGLIGGLDTLCSQAYGARKYELVGIFANITRIAIMCFFLFVCLPCVYFCSNILLFLGQFPQVVEVASGFCFSMLPSLFFALQFNANLRYLQSMNIFMPGMFVTLTTAFFHPLWCYLFIIKLGFEVNGAGISMGITHILNYSLITLYICVKNPNPESFFFYHEDMFKRELIWRFIKKAVPASILSAADWLGFEMLTLMSSYLSPLDLAANICLFNFITLIFMIPLGLSFAETTLVGNSIGERNPDKAKVYAKAGLVWGVGIIGVITIFVMIYREVIPYVYTTEPDIAVKVTGLLGLYVWFSIIDAVQMVLHGVIKGLGKQKIASGVCLMILYPINIPMAYYLCFYLEIGLMGLWYSQLISCFLLGFSYIAILIYLDWDKLAEHTAMLHNREDEQIHHTKAN